MHRFALRYLESWLKKPGRKPIVLRGARQVGKTYTVRELAKLSGMQLVEVNFEKHIGIQSLFASNDPQTIITNLEAKFAVSIDVGNTILFLDEIQAAPEILAKLRWFAEGLAELAVVAAGSLLDFILDEHKFSMPVGRITYLHMTPLSFDEYLLISGKHQLLGLLQGYNLGQEIPIAIHNQLMEIFKEYVIVGGMPAALYSWHKERSLAEVQRIHLDLLSGYRDDFAKYAGRISTARLDEVITAIPRMLGHKFVYSHVNKNIKAATLKQSLDLLAKARICQKVQASHANGLPLASELNNKAYKVVFLDVGLLSSQLGLMLHDIQQTEDINVINSGAICEQLVGQLLQTIEPFYVDPFLCYWLREKSSSNAEIDYLIQHATNIIPIEVKSGKTGTLKSLHLFMQCKQLQLAVRINSTTPSMVEVSAITHAGPVQYNLLSIPLYMIGQLHNLLDQANSNIAAY